MAMPFVQESLYAAPQPGEKTPTFYHNTQKNMLCFSLIHLHVFNPTNMSFEKPFTWLCILSSCCKHPSGTSKSNLMQYQSNLIIVFYYLTYLLSFFSVLQLCSCSTTVWRSTCGRGVSPSRPRARPRPGAAGTARGGAPCRRRCSTAKVGGSRQMRTWKGLLVVCVCVFKNNVLTLLCIPEMNPRRPPQAYLIHEGSEPLTFTNVFPRWEKSPGPHIQVGPPLSHDQFIM